jgi:hypothetical protein
MVAADDVRSYFDSATCSYFGTGFDGIPGILWTAVAILITYLVIDFLNVRSKWSVRREEGLQNFKTNRSYFSKATSASSSQGKDVVTVVEGTYRVHFPSTQLIDY